MNVLNHSEALAINPEYSVIETNSVSIYLNKSVKKSSYLE